jgi:cytochrome P450
MIDNPVSCPYSRYRNLSEAAAVVETKPGVYALTRYEDCKAVLLDWRTYSAVVGDNNVFATYGPSPVQNEIDEIMRVYPEEMVLMRSDPPVHTRVRNLVSRVLMPKEVEKIIPQIRARVEELAGAWIGKGDVEFVGAFASPLPNAITTQFLGSPPEMRPTMKLWANEAMSRLAGPQSPERQLEVARHLADMARYFLAEIAERRRHPNGDLVSMLAHAEIDGDRLQDTAIINVISNFVAGGHETQTYLLGNSLWRLANDPSLANTLRDKRELIPVFIEEMLRIEPPSPSVVRTPTRDVEIGGVKVPAGSVILLTVAAANRDEAAFETPHEVHLDRSGEVHRNGHLAFGYGSHSCLGLHLARAEVRSALEFLLPRMTDIVPGSDDPIEWVDNFMLCGPKRLHLRFTPTS